MRKFVLLLLALMIVPDVTFAAPKHGKWIHEKVNELGHKKRMKKAAKESGAKKHGLLHH